MARTIICPVCKKEWDLRWGVFGHDSLSRHMKATHRIISPVLTYPAK